MRTNLKILRVKHGYTQEQMAEYIGCKRATYSAIESGARDSTLDFWQKVQNKCGISDADMWALMQNEG